MTTAAKASYAHVTHNPKVLGGRACIDATRIRVLDVVEALKQGHTPEQIRGLFAVPLTLGQVHAALSYYYDHPDEINAAERESERWESEHERERRAYLTRLPK
jgi:uncharacterized protein (DUF433 family)